MRRRRPKRRRRHPHCSRPIRPETTARSGSLRQGSWRISLRTRAAGTPYLMALFGSAGSGKSALLRQVLSQLRTLGGGRSKDRADAPDLPRVVGLRVDASSGAEAAIRPHVTRCLGAQPRLSQPRRGGDLCRRRSGQIRTRRGRAGQRTSPQARLGAAGARRARWPTGEARRSRAVRSLPGRGWTPMRAPTGRASSPGCGRSGSRLRTRSTATSIWCAKRPKGAQAPRGSAWCCAVCGASRARER